MSNILKISNHFMLENQIYLGRPTENKNGLWNVNPQKKGFFITLKIMVNESY